MTITPWLPVVEQLPPEGQVVIVAQAVVEDGYRIFSGWLKEGHDGSKRWWTYDPDVCLSTMGPMRATDFWLPLPQGSPQDNVVRGGYPA